MSLDNGHSQHPAAHFLTSFIVSNLICDRYASDPWYGIHVLTNTYLFILSSLYILDEYAKVSKVLN